MAQASPYDPYVQVLSRRLGKPKPGGSDEIRFCTPFLREGSRRRDKNYHLYVNISRKKFFCFKSEQQGSLSYLFRLLDEEYTEQPRTVQPLAVLKERAQAIAGEGRKFEQPRTGLPEEYSPVTYGSVAHQYLISRGISGEDIQYYKLGEGRAGTDLADWVIIPSFDDYARCDYWVARRTDQSWGRKYENPSSPRRYHVPFLHTALANSASYGTVVLCEGVFSALVAGRDAAASLGKFVTNHQLSYMRQSGVTKIRLALDGDAWKEAIDTAQRCLRMSLNVSLVPLPSEQDPADLGRQAFRALLHREIEATTCNLMRLRLGRIT